MDSIFNYLDYRAFLRDYYESRKKSETFFSYRYMANKLKMDHSLLVKILSGKRHIADNAIENFITFCKFSKREAQYFETLIHFDKARSKEQSRLYFEALLHLKGYRYLHIQGQLQGTGITVKSAHNSSAGKTGNRPAEENEAD